MGAALEAILPAGVVAVERASLDDDDVRAAIPPLYPGEEDLIAGASEGRRREFAEARACAREALEQLGIIAGPILATPDGAPVWPAGVVGSITHKGGYRAAIVARRADLAGVGIDAEADEPLRDGLLGTIASSAEIARVERLLAAQPGLAWDRLLFSAKEAAVKAARPAGAGAAGVRAVEISLDPDARAFTAVVGGGASAPVAGAWAQAEGLLVTMASIR